ncbi:MAG TPA: thioredoxin family protein, partial [Blastocatellia bacterium]|nr:thioredoxin family protein [Blastocatellia bacterium]
RTVNTISKDAFQFGADRTSATCDLSALRPAGKFTRVDGPVYAFVASGKLVLIRSHPGATGEMSLDKLWETVPVWRSVMKNYEPNAEAVSRIKADDKDTTVTLAFGTWCPDSKNYVPRLLKALNAAGNPRIQLKLIGIDNQFREPVASVQPLRITNVPTVIIERDGREVGRIVETPAAKTIEEDLAAILGGKQPIHNGRWERGPRIASGTYSYRERGGKEVGAESWDLFSTPEGGFLVHSRITSGDLSTDVFHRVEASRRPSFAEVTKLHGNDRTRTRFNVEGNTLTARTRGSVSGVIAQTLEVPERFFISSPAVAAQGFMQSSNVTRYQISTYPTPTEFENATALLSLAACETGDEESVRVPAGEFRVRHITRKTEREKTEWWIDVKLGVPVKGQSRGVEYVLKSLEISSAR